LAHSAVFSWGAIIGLLMVKATAVETSFAIIAENAPAWMVVPVWLYRVVISLLTNPAYPLWLAFPLAIILAGLLAVALERVAFYPLRQRKAPRLSQLISSIGAAILLVNLGQLLMNDVFGNTLDYFPTDLISNDPLPGLAVRITPLRIAIVVISLALMIALNYVVARTRIGRAVRTVAFNERIAALLGVDTERVFQLTFFMAGALGGAAGMLYGMIFINVEPFMGDSVSLVGLVAIVLGGLGSINGAVLGGFIVAGLQTFSVAVGGGSYRNTVIFILLFLVLVVRPEGLMGTKRQDRA
ncbi:MAG: branched-chain amino acid ABC transporter permease, partial [Chloroflexota bacterium]